MKITNFIYNTIIELVIIFCIIIWFICGCTIIIPLLWNMGGQDYWYITDFINDMRYNKI